MVANVRAQEKGIGRGMKASKEALCGVLEALEQWKRRDEQAWVEHQTDKVLRLIERLNDLKGVLATSDPSTRRMGTA